MIETNRLLLLPAPGAATPARPAAPPPRVATKRHDEDVVYDARRAATGKPADPRAEVEAAGRSGWAQASGGTTAFAAQLFAQSELGDGLHIEPRRSGMAAYARTAALTEAPEPRLSRSA